MEGNYIKINRSILEWEWYGNINTCRLFLHILLKANWRDGRFEGKEILRGSFVSSYPRLAEECGLTVNEVRTALKHLISTGEITVKAHAKYTVFTVVKYNDYQEINSQSTDKSHSINRRLTTIEERKKGRKEEYIPPISPVEHFEEFTEAYPKKCTSSTVATEYCNAVASGVPEMDLVNAAKNYALHCQREKTPGQFIKNPDNFIKDNTFMKYVEGVKDEPGRNIEQHEKSLNEIMAERGIGGEFTGF